MPRPQFTIKSMLWLVAVVAAFCAGTQLNTYLEEHRADPRETKIRAALDDTTDLDFAYVALSDVVDYLKQRHDIEIQLDAKALVDAGVSTDIPITLSIKDISLRSALKLLLSEAELTYVVHNGVLMITSRTEAENMSYHFLTLETTLWLLVVLAAFLVGIQCERTWRHRKDKRATQL
jgi:hypothetical protein